MTATHEPHGGAVDDSDDGPAVTGPTALRVVLGGQLRHLREANGISREAAGEVIRSSASKISRLELGRVSVKSRDLSDLLTLYGVTGEAERADVLMLAREAAKPGWWHQYGELLPSWFEYYVGLEAAASRIRTYEVQFVPGLLQTPEYARAVIKLGNPTATLDELEQRVSLRMKRQQILTGPNGPKLWAVIDETALCRRLGGPGVMEAQLERLIEFAASPNITVYVVPLQSGYHAAAAGAFSILRFAAPELSDVVYLEQLTSALYLDKRRDVDQYSAVMDQLCVQAEKRAGTKDILSQIRDRMR
ncbi:MAG TPA: helix-turn-helix transcriptional regulator [Streptosporangiaceae bacterium]|nr:helix-turn-helix transcriptional regulator [Streptosporangiaceae bacterium]